MTSQTKERLSSIDGLRGFVSIVIMAAHMVMSLTFEDLPVFIRNSGIFPVQIFFGLSGMLVYLSYSRKVTKEKYPVFNFYLRRLGRIVPLWWLILVVATFVKDLPLEVWAANVFLTFGFFLHQPIYDPIGTSWALFVEGSFYLIFPLIFPRLSAKTIVPVILFSSILSFFWLRFAGPLGVPTGNLFVERFPLFHLKFFFIGVGVAFLMETGKFWDDFTEGLRPWIDGIVVFSILSYVFSDRISREAFAFFCILTAFVKGSFINRIVNLPVFHWIGIRCYGFYLIHCPVLYFVLEGLRAFWPSFESYSLGLKFTLLFTSVLSFTALIATVTFIVLERPLMVLMEGWLQRREARGGTT